MVAGYSRVDGGYQFFKRLEQCAHPSIHQSLPKGRMPRAIFEATRLRG